MQREFDPTEPNQLWFSDITYIRTWEGWLYLAIVLDAYSRKVVGWALVDHMRTELVTAALQMALANRQPAPGLVCHSDRGSQYTSAEYRDLLEEHGLRHSVGQPGTCWDNAVAESFFATLKNELIYLHVWPTRQSARTAIFGFIEGWYNLRRTFADAILGRSMIIPTAEARATSLSPEGRDKPLFGITTLIPNSG